MMDMPRCRDCVHWEFDVDGDATEGICYRMKPRFLSAEDDLAWVRSENCTLVTRPDFSCVLFKSKP